VGLVCSAGGTGGPPRDPACPPASSPGPLQLLEARIELRFAGDGRSPRRAPRSGAAPASCRWPNGSPRLPPLFPTHPAPQEVLAFLASPESSDAGAVLAKAMRLGETNFRVMALLDRGHTSK
jgi:hypothetical protein